MIETNSTKIILCKILKEIKTGNDISYGEILFLQEHQADIKRFFPNDPLLWQWANIPESEWNGAGENE